MLLETARTFEARGRPDVAAALYELLVEQYPETAAAVEARARLVALPLEAEGDGGVALQVWSTIYGAWLGLAVPGALGADGSEAYGLGLLVGGPAGFLVGRRLARSTELTEGQAGAVSLGAWWGTWQGFGWQEVFELGVSQECPIGTSFCFDEPSDEEAFAGAVVGGLVGIAAGALLARREITPGTSTVMNFGPLWGSWFGLAGGILAGLEDDDLLASTLIAGNAGLVTAAILAPRWNVTRSRARLVSIAGVLGGLAGAGIDLLVQPDDEKGAIAIPLLGSVGGLGLGIAATRERPESAGDGEANALLLLRDGRLRVGTPLPMPGLVRGPTGRGDAWRAVLRLELLDARF